MNIQILYKDHLPSRSSHVRLSVRPYELGDLGNYKSWKANWE